MTRIFDEGFWDERYAGKGSVWSGNPNPQLVSEISGPGTLSTTEPKTALDVGCGEGADSVWLAGQGWHVTGVDISRVALQRARDHEAEPSLSGSITWEHHDLLQWTPPSSSFDLVSIQFMHLPRNDRELVHARLAAAVRTGGTLLIVGHAESDVLAGARRPKDSELFFTAVETSAALEPDHWRVELAESRPRLDKGHDGETITVHDEVMRAVRLA